jgi:hypothetical protein
MAGGIGVTERLAMTTIEEWAKVVSEETERFLVLPALMKKKGLIQYGCSGGQFRWVPRIKDHQLKDFVDFQPVDVERVHTVENAFLPWRGYYIHDAISLREKLEQGGPEAMIKVFANREGLMRDGAMRGLADQFFIDGNATGNTNKFHGIESFMGIAAQTASDILATTHDDSYAGLSTAVGGISGATNTRAWTPTIINTNHTPTGGQKTWANYADEYIRTALLRLKFGNGPRNTPDLVMLTRAAYEDYLNLIDDKERIPVSRGANLGLTKLGFGNHVEQDGCAIMWDDSVPQTDSDLTTADDGTDVRGYVFTTSQMQMKVLGGKGSKQLFTPKVTFNDSYRADNIFMHLLGNLKFEGPRHFGKFADISAVAS